MKTAILLAFKNQTIITYLASKLAYSKGKFTQEVVFAY